jgi:hypothetical protein
MLVEEVVDQMHQKLHNLVEQAVEEKDIVLQQQLLPLKDKEQLTLVVEEVVVKHLTLQVLVVVE